MTQPTVPTDYTPEQLEDMAARNAARRMEDALALYAGYRSRALQCSLLASQGGGDEATARAAMGFRADAKAALHAYPDLLVMVEGNG